MSLWEWISIGRYANVPIHRYRTRLSDNWLPFKCNPSKPPPYYAEDQMIKTITQMMKLCYINIALYAEVESKNPHSVY